MPRRLAQLAVRHSHTSLALRAQCRTGVALELPVRSGVVGRRKWRLELSVHRSQPAMQRWLIAMPRARNL